MKNIPGRAAIVIFFLGIVLSCICISLKLRSNSLKDKAYKKDYFAVNQIKYGMLSGDNWSLQVNKIIEQQIDSFSLNPENKKVLTEQINALLLRLFNEADAVLHKKRKGIKEKLKFKIINAFVDVNDFKPEIPRFSRAIVDEIDKSKNKAQVKLLLKDKVSGILNAANQDVEGEQQCVLDKYKYNADEIPAFNKCIAEKTHEIKEEQKVLGYLLIGLLVLTLLFWIVIVKTKILYITSFLFSVVVSFIALAIGVSLPMIEIDARIATLDLKLLSSHIIFNDQVIFFQTKSILDVIHILISDGKGDTVFVGCLILLFSVLFPVTKLICAIIYLYKREKSNAVIKYMAFKSGKWSMADVMVVAIFMAYVGFQGILNNQLEDVTVHNDTINVITTNKSNLHTGFLIFVAFVLFNLALAEILKHITKRDFISAAPSSPKENA